MTQGTLRRYVIHRGTSARSTAIWLADTAWNAIEQTPSRNHPRPPLSLPRQTVRTHEQVVKAKVMIRRAVLGRASVRRLRVPRVGRHGWVGLVFERGRMGLRVKRSGGDQGTAGRSLT